MYIGKSLYPGYPYRLLWRPIFRGNKLDDRLRTATCFALGDQKWLVGKEKMLLNLPNLTSCDEWRCDLGFVQVSGGQDGGCEAEVLGSEVGSQAGGSPASIPSRHTGRGWGCDPADVATPRTRPDMDSWHVNIISHLTRGIFSLLSEDPGPSWNCLPLWRNILQLRIRFLSLNF